MDTGELRIEIKRELVTTDGKRFSISEDIAFSICNEESNNLDRIICRIADISCYGYIVADEVEINGCESNNRIFHLKDMKDIDYVYVD